MTMRLTCPCRRMSMHAHASLGSPPRGSHTHFLPVVSFEMIAPTRMMVPSTTPPFCVVSAICVDSIMELELMPSLTMSR